MVDVFKKLVMILMWFPVIGIIFCHFIFLREQYLFLGEKFGRYTFFLYLCPVSNYREKTNNLPNKRHSPV